MSNRLSKKNWQVPIFKKNDLFKKRNDYCICVPVINEGKRIKNQLKRMIPYADVVDIIICDGGSTDNSLELNFLKKCKIKTLLTKTDSGRLSAQLRMGFSYAIESGYQGVITIDGNGKDGVDAIPIILEKLKNGFDFIQASRFVKGGNAANTPIVRLLSIKFIHAPLISLIAGKKYTDTTNGFRGFSKKYLLHPKVRPFRNIFDSYELLAYLSVRADQLGLKTTEVPATRRYPKKGKIPTKISSIKGNLSLLKILIDIVLGAYDPKS